MAVIISFLVDDFTKDQLVEIEKLLDYIQKMEGIVRTSPSADQVSRVRKQILQYGERLKKYIPEINVSRINTEQIKNQLGLSEKYAERSNSSKSSVSDAPVLDILSRYPTQPASPNSTDKEINFLATSVRIIQKEYWPIILDQHCKLDFSHSTERDAIRAQFESSNRSLKILMETIEEYANADKQDFREQLLKMKNKQSRVFMYEVNDNLKKMRDFLQKLVKDINFSGNVIMNKGQTLRFNPRYEDATALEGRILDEGIREFFIYVDQVIEKLNLPEMKIKQ